MENKSKVDHFSRLPNELVQAVVDQLSLQDRPNFLPALSKRFLSFHRSSLYKFVQISGRNQFERFLECMQQNPSHIPLIVDLILCLPDFLQDCSQPQTLAKVTNFFTSLVNLHGLAMEATFLVHSLFMNLPHPISPRFKYLHLGFSYTDQISSHLEMSPSFLDSLTTYPNLLHLGLSRILPPSKPDTPSSPSPRRFPALTSLEIVAPHPRNPRTYRDLFERCSPTDVRITENVASRFPSNAIPTLLATIVEPGIIKRLVLDSAQWIVLPRLNHVLSTLVNLEDLTLERNASSFEDQFYEVLGKLPLRKLTFGQGTYVCSTGLYDNFLAAQTGHTLQVLELNHEWAYRGDKVNPHSRDDSWCVPEWCQYFDQRDCERIMLRAQELGIEVKGSAIEALGIEDEYHDLVQRWEAARKDAGQSDKDSRANVTVIEGKPGTGDEREEVVGSEQARQEETGEER